MDRRNIKEKELRQNKNKKYLYISKDKNVVPSGETVEEFLARGGTIKRIENTSNIERDMDGKFTKKDVAIAVIL